MIKLIFDKIDGNDLTIGFTDGRYVSPNKELVDKITKLDEEEQSALMKILNQAIEKKNLPSEAGSLNEISQEAAKFLIKI